MRTVLSLLASLCLGACAVPVVHSGVSVEVGAEDTAASESAQSASGRVGAHGMVVAGTPGAAFLSHIPMFQAPHDVQLLVAGAFVAPDGAPLPATFSDELFTFLPDRMSLDALRTGALRELRGTLYLGNFEAGGRPLPSRVRFVVARIVHEHVLDAAATTPPALEYFIFGSRAQTFAAHRLAGAPGFDEVVRVVLAGDPPPDVELAAGVLTRIGGSADVPAKRLGLVSGARHGEAGARSFTITSRVTLSCLHGPDFTRACAER